MVCVASQFLRRPSACLLLTQGTGPKVAASTAPAVDADIVGAPESRPQSGVASPDTSSDEGTRGGAQGSDPASNPPSECSCRGLEPAVDPPLQRSRCELACAGMEDVRKLLQLIKPGERLGDLSAFAKVYCDAAFCSRLLRKYGGDVGRSAEKLETALRWRQQHEKLLTTLQFEEASDLRVVGFDRGGRPILYQCCRNQMLTNTRGLDQYVVRMEQAVAMMPPGVEKMTHIWDMHGLKPHLNMNPAAVLHLLAVLEGYFAGRLHQLIIVDMPRVAVFLKDAIWPAVPDSTKQKVRFFGMEEAVVHIQTECDDIASGNIRAVMLQNRDVSTTLQLRRSTWVHVERTAPAGSKARTADDDTEMIPV